MSMSSDLIFSVEQHLGLVTLNRPQALHALTHDMIRSLYAQLHAWATDSDIHAVIIRAGEGRAFCAGGDVRGLYESGLKNREAPLHFFRDEYRLNHFIAHYPKPYVPLVHGFTFGGGVGISLHSSYAVASEDFVFSMPETTIGFFPDVGASHILSQCQDGYGIYLGLTGARLNAKEALALKLIRAIVPLTQFDALIHSLLKADLTQHPEAQIERCIQMHQLHCDVELEHAQEIKHCFEAASMTQIKTMLAHTQTVWAETTLQQLQQKSPTSLAVTLEQLKRARMCSLDECLNMDYALTYHFMQHQDFFEGVRALLIDKDKNPRWAEAPNQKEVEAYFNLPKHLAPLELDKLPTTRE